MWSTSPTSYQLKCFVMCTPAPTHTPYISSQIRCNSLFPFRECHLGCSCSRGTKQMEALRQCEASLWSEFHVDFSISPRNTCTYRRSESNSFCKAGIDFVLASEPSWCTYVWFSCFIYPHFSCSSLCNVSAWICWGRELAFTLRSGRMVREE